MLIRSQDKRKLADTTGKLIRAIGQVVYLSDFVCREVQELLEIGRYKSKARAIDVLDEIQKSYTDTCTAAAVGGGFCIYDNKVFEMPEE